MYAFVEIKTDNLQLAPGLKILRAEDYSHFLQAQSLVKAAEEKAKAIIDAAKAVYQQEKQRGYDDGLTQSKLECTQQMIATVDQCQKFYKESENVLCNIVISAVRNVLADFDDTALTGKVVAQALHLVSNQKQVTLHVHPDTVTDTRERVTEILIQFPEVGYVEVVGDARLRNGGCIVETQIGIIDASIDGQLEVLQQTIERRFSEMPANTTLNNKGLAASSGQLSG